MEGEGREPMDEDEVERRGASLRLGFVHRSVRRPRHVPYVQVVEAPAYGEPGPDPPGQAPKARRGRGLRLVFGSERCSFFQTPAAAAELSE